MLWDRFRCVGCIGWVEIVVWESGGEECGELDEGGWEAFCGR